ncbi:MAG: GNAT family N-acetyltransferase [Cocleimonas sp.]
MAQNAPHHMSFNKSNALTLRLVDSLEQFQTLQSDWDTLYDQSSRSNIFVSWDWLFTWWEIFKDQYKRELYILTVYQEDTLVGIAPFQICSAPLPRSLIQGKTLQFIGNGEAWVDSIVSVFQDFIVLPEFESEVTALVSDYLIEHSKKWQFADFEYLLKDALILQCFKGSGVDESSNKVTRNKVEYGGRFTIPSLDSFELYKEQMGKRWSKMFRKKSNRLEREGEVTTVVTDSLESIKPALTQLAEMNCSRWKGKTGHCVFDSERFFSFHEKIMERLLPKQKAAIKTLHLDGAAMASYYVLSDKGQVHYYQSGFHAEYGNRYSPLFLLIVNGIGEAIKNNILFDFMFADDKNSYKKEQYSCDHEPMYRLHWSPQKFRLPLFHSVKAAKDKITNIKEVINNKLNKSQKK